MFQWGELTLASCTLFLGTIVLRHLSTMLCQADVTKATSWTETGSVIPISAGRCQLQVVSFSSQFSSLGGDTCILPQLHYNSHKWWLWLIKTIIVDQRCLRKQGNDNFRMHTTQIVKTKSLCVLNDRRECVMCGALHHLTMPDKWGVIQIRQHQHFHVKGTTETRPCHFLWKHHTVCNQRYQLTFDSLASFTFLSISIELPRIVWIHASLFSSI